MGIHRWIIFDLHMLWMFGEDAQSCNWKLSYNQNDSTIQQIQGIVLYLIYRAEHNVSMV